MSKTLSNIADSILNLTHIFKNLSQINKIADDNSEDSNNPADPVKRRRIVPTGTTQSATDEPKLDVKRMLAPAKEEKREIPKLNLSEVDLGRELILNETNAKLAEINKVELDENYALVQNIIDYIAKFREVALVKNLELARGSGNQRVVNTIEENLGNIDIFLVKMYRLKIIYNEIKQTDGLGIKQLIDEIKYYNPEDDYLQLIPFGSEEFQEQIKATLSLMKKAISHLKKINGISVRLDNAKKRLASLSAQGFSTEESKDVKDRLQELKDLDKDEILEEIKEEVSEDSKKIKTKELLASLQSTIQDLSDYESEDDNIQLQFDNLGSGQQDLMQGGGESGVTFAGRAQTLTLSFEEKMKVIIENNNARIDQIKKTIESINDQIRSSTSQAQKERLEGFKKYEEKKLSVLESKVKKNIEAREQISRLCDAYLADLDRLKNLGDKEGIEAARIKIAELEDKIRSIAELQRNLLAVARYQDYINPYKAEQKVKIDPNKLSTFLRDRLGVINLDEFRKKIEDTSFSYIKFKSNPTAYPGKNASKFKEEYPQWIKFIENKTSPSNLLVYFGSESNLSEQVRNFKQQILALLEEESGFKNQLDSLQAKIKDIESMQSNSLLTSKDKERLEQQKIAITTEIEVVQEELKQLSQLCEEYLSGGQNSIIANIFNSNLEYFIDLSAEVENDSLIWRQKESTRTSVLNQVNAISARANRLLLSGEDDRQSIEKIKSELDSILSDQDKAKYLQGKVYQGYIENIQRFINRSESPIPAGASISEDAEIAENFGKFSAAINVLIQYFSTTSSTSQRKILNQIASLVQSGKNKEYLSGLLKFLIEKVSDEASLEAIKREIFVETYLKDIKARDLGEIYQNKVVVQEHKKRMREFVNQIAGSEVTYAPLLQASQREIDKVIAVIDTLNPAEIQQYLPLSVSSIRDLKGEREVIASLRSIKQKYRAVNNPRLIQILFKRPDFRSEMQVIKSYYDSCKKEMKKPGDPPNYIRNLETAISNYENISDQKLTTELPSSVEPSAQAGATIESEMVPPVKATEIRSATFSPPPKEKTFFGQIIAKSLKMFASASQNGSVDELNQAIGYIDQLINNEEIIQREKNIFISHGESQGFEDQEKINESFQKWIFNTKQLLEKIKTNCSNKIAELQTK